MATLPYGVMTGALTGSGFLPLDGQGYERRLEINFQGDRLAVNLEAFRLGLAEIKKALNTESV